MFALLGTPTEAVWPGFLDLPTVRKVQFKQFPAGALRRQFMYLTEATFGLLTGCLNYDPASRLTAEDALKHRYFEEAPAPTPPELFPYWPAKSEGAPTRQYPVRGRNPQSLFISPRSYVHRVQS
jgi:cell division cycle 2-like protein